LGLNLTLAATDTLSGVTDLTVNGALTLGAAAAARGDVTVSGTITVDGSGAKLDMGTHDLTLLENGVLETKGGGTVVIGETTFGGVGTWTATPRVAMRKPGCPE
jgi:hypothetical protein